MVRERCHLRHCRTTRLQVRSGDWGRRSRWHRPLQWNPPRLLKAPGGSSAHIPTDLPFNYTSEISVFIQVWFRLNQTQWRISADSGHSGFWLCSNSRRDCVCLRYLKISQQAQAGRWSAGAELLLWLICVPLLLWTHPANIKTHTWATCLKYAGSQRARWQVSLTRVNKACGELLFICK